MPKNAKALADEMEGMWSRAEREGRDLTSDERSHMEELVEAAKQQHSLEQQIKSMDPGAPLVRLMNGDSTSVYGGGPGDRFVASKGWKSIADPGGRPTNWSTGLVEVSPTPLLMKGTLLEGTGSPGSGSGGGLLATPQVVPGAVETLFQPLTFESLLSGGVATGNTVRYAIEGTATSGAAGVAEGGDKPQSAIALSTKDEPIKKIATTLVVSDELVDDAPAVQQFVNGRLGLFVQIETERQLFRGTSGGNEVQGMLTSRGVPVYAGGTAAGNKAVQLFKAMNGTRGSSFMEPEWIVMHPTDWEQIRLLTDTAGQYFGGGPFQGPYGGGGNAQASGQITGAADLLWNKPVYVTTAIGGAGTALVGNSQAGQVWSRGGVSVELTNSHSDYFFKDLVAMRAERRLGLTLYRPGAYCEVRLA